MEFVSDVLGKGKGFDPDLGINVHIPEPYVPIGTWTDELNSLMDSAEEKSWAITTVDDALFVGCYVKKSIEMSPAVFLCWIDQFSDGEYTPLARLIDCVSQPLSLPIFALPIPFERQLDLVFGRLHVCMGISLPALISASAERGIEARPPNKKERRSISRSKGASLIRYRGHPLVFERGEKSMVIADGVFHRAFFHLQRPVEVIEALFDYADIGVTG